MDSELQVHDKRGRGGVSILTVSLGAVLAMLLGSGLIARTSDTAASNGNIARSGTFTPRAHDVDIAEVANLAGGDCSTAVYQESAGAAITTTGVNINLDSLSQIEQGTTAGRKDFCVKNAGTAAGKLTVQFTSVTDLE